MVDWRRSRPAPEQEYTDIGYETGAGIAKITINRPEVRNALRPTALFEPSSVFNAARDAFGDKRSPDLARFPQRP